VFQEKKFSALTPKEIIIYDPKPEFLELITSDEYNQVENIIVYSDKYNVWFDFIDCRKDLATKKMAIVKFNSDRALTLNHVGILSLHCPLHKDSTVVCDELIYRRLDVYFTGCCVGGLILGRDCDAIISEYDEKKFDSYKTYVTPGQKNYVLSEINFLRNNLLASDKNNYNQNVKKITYNVYDNLIALFVVHQSEERMLVRTKVKWIPDGSYTFPTYNVGEIVFNYEEKPERNAKNEKKPDSKNNTRIETCPLDKMGYVDICSDECDPDKNHMGKTNNPRTEGSSNRSLTSSNNPHTEGSSNHRSSILPRIVSSFNYHPTAPHDEILPAYRTNENTPHTTPNTTPRNSIRSLPSYNDLYPEPSFFDRVRGFFFSE